MVKPCIRCGATDRTARGDCKPCKRVVAANYREVSPEKIKIAKIKWVKNNPEKRKIAYSKWAKNNTEKLRLKNAQYRKANPDAHANWYKANPEKVKLSCAKWKKANPEKVNIYWHNRRARKRANGGELSLNLTETLLKKQKGKCACCKEPLGKDYHLDHIMPLALGGMNEDWNMQLLKTKCNLSKGSKHPIEYMQNKGLLL